MPTMDAVARAGFLKVTDGTSTATVKAASTAAVATDPALVVAVSPNNTVLTQGAGANGAAVTGNPVLHAGSDGTNARTIKTDTAGNQIVVGATASGAAPSTAPVLAAGWDGTNAYTLRTTNSGNLAIEIGRAHV